MARFAIHGARALERRRRDILLLTSLLAAVFICFGAANAATGQSFKVTSTLDGKTVLPHHIHWYAYVSGTSVRTVDFLIDGKLRWTQKKAPYIYGDQEDNFKTVDRGYLVTSFFEPRVASLHGACHRHQRTARGRHDHGARPTGCRACSRAQRHLGAHRRPGGRPHARQSRRAGRYANTGRDLQARARQPLDPDAQSGHVHPRERRQEHGARLHPGHRLGARSDDIPGLGRRQLAAVQRLLGEEGTWCLPWGGPQATYHWSVSGNTLTLTPVGSDPCRVRQFIWAGEWTRVD